MTTIAPQLFPAGQTQATSDDYYTPKWIFERMGIEFDLDVACPPGGIPWIPAKRYFTMEDDGLSQPWEGRVWMNPPYSQVAPWWERFAGHRRGVCLLPMVKSSWVDRVWGSADAIVLTEGGGKVGFMRNGKPTEIMFPTFFAAFGDECVEAIARLGRVR